MWCTVMAILSLTSVGCAADGSEDWSVTVDTLSSGAVQVFNSGSGRWGSTPPWQLVESVKIGTRHGSGPELFGDIADIEVDVFGRIYALDRMAQEIRVFKPDGSHLRTIGRLGHGPGEFHGTTGIVFDHEGRLWALNQNNVRFSVFDSSGILFREYPWRFRGAASAQWESVFSPEGQLLHVTYFQTPTGTGTGLVQYDPAAQEGVDTFPTPSLPEGTKPLTGRRRLMANGWWVGRQYEYRLVNLTHEGDTLKVIERAREAENLAPAERDSMRRQEEALQRRLVSGSLDMETERRPLFDAFAADEEGFLWVFLVPAPEESRTRIDVFDSDGVYLGELTAPHLVDRRTQVVFNGDRLYYVTRDEMDVPYVVGAQITGRY